MKWKVLHELYPFDESPQRAIRSAIFFGAFVFCFLYFFQPFGLSYYNSEKKTLQLVGYGLVTSFCLLINFFGLRFFFPKSYNKASWTVLKNIIYTVWMFFIIGLGNSIDSISQGFISFSIDSFLFYQGLTLIIGLFPVTISTFFIYNRRLSAMVKEAKQLNHDFIQSEASSETQIEIPSLAKADGLKVDINSLVFIKAVENYVELYLLEQSELQKKLIRNTLKNTEAALTQFEQIKKCHRSYLVNLQHVDRFSGNAQGLTLHLKEDLALTIPVSRSFVKTIKNQLKP